MIKQYIKINKKDTVTLQVAMNNGRVRLMQEVHSLCRLVSDVQAQRLGKLKLNI
jgi:hypothetical protein